MYIYIHIMYIYIYLCILRARVPNAAQLFLLARARSRVSHDGETVKRPSEAEKLLALLLATHLSQKYWPLSQN